MGKYMSCEKMARCTLDECDPKTCEGYKYNHRRYNAFAKSVLVPMSDEALVAVGFIHEHQTAKAVTLKRKMKISQAEADTLLDVLEALGYIGKVKENGEPRDILFDLKKPLSEILGSE